MNGIPYLLATALVCAASAQVKPPELKLKVGDKAPDFTLPSTDAKDVKLSDFRGKKSVVVAFFPKAFTGG